MGNSSNPMNSGIRIRDSMLVDISHSKRNSKRTHFVQGSRNKRPKGGNQIELKILVPALELSFPINGPQNARIIELFTLVEQMTGLCQRKYTLRSQNGHKISRTRTELRLTDYDIVDGDSIVLDPTHDAAKDLLDHYQIDESDRAPENDTYFGEIPLKKRGKPVRALRRLVRKRNFRPVHGGVTYSLNVYGKYEDDKWLKKNSRKWKDVYHGTHPDNLPSIIEKGLLVGGDKVGVANGAHHGKGIYVSPDPWTAESFSRSVKVDLVHGTFSQHVILQCRVRKKSYRKASVSIWVVENPEDVRVYAVYVKGCPK